MLHSYMRPQTQPRPASDGYVSSPPALFIVDEFGKVFALAEEFGTVWDGNKSMGEFVFRVLVNGNKSGYFASRIEMRRGKVRIFTKSGWKDWTGKEFI